MCGTADPCFLIGGRGELVGTGRADYLLLFIVCWGELMAFCARGWGWTFPPLGALVGGVVCVNTMPWVAVVSQGCGRACLSKVKKGHILIAKQFPSAKEAK
jgi:hypothetical protein